MKKNILITGSSGFLGKSLVQYLTLHNLNIFTSNRQSKDKNVFHFDLENKYDKNFIQLKKIDVLIHCAYSLNYSLHKEGRKINLLGSKKVFEMAKEINAKIIYISSISAYKKSISNYGKIKFEIENLAIKYNAIIIRPGLIYSQQSQGGIFGSVVNLIKKLPIIPLVGDGKQLQYMCKLNELCILIYNLINMKNLNTKIIIAANTEPIEFKEIINIIIKKYKIKKTIIFFPTFVIFYILKFVECFYSNLSVKSDNLISLLNPNTNLEFENLDKYNVKFPIFESDFLLNDN